MSQDKKILIVGGGIAGLVLARALRTSGWTSRMVEVEPEWNPSGTGLYVPANGVYGLDQLGLGEEARSRGFIIERRHLLTSNADAVLDLDLEAVWDRQHPCLGIHRHALHEILLEGAGDIDITLSTTIAQLDADPDGVDVEFSDGSQDRFELVVGADGIRSVVRTLIMGEVNLRLVSPMVSRFVTTRAPELQAWTLFGSQKGLFLMVPISEDEVYCYVSRKGSSAPGKIEYMTPFKSFAAPVSQLIATFDPEQAYWSPLEELSPLEIWGRGRVILIGDAAHAMPPFMAQGGALAIEDALVLARLLEEIDWSKTAEIFTETRTARVDWVRKRNRRREKLAKLPFFIANIGTRLTGKKSWTADYAPLREPPNGL